MKPRWLLCLLLLGTPITARTDDNWPDYRGPHANGHSAATGLPLRWSETQNVKWKTPIHGRGWSTPIIWENQVWLTTATPDGTDMFVLCVEKETGKILLDRKLFTNAEPEPINDLNSYASPSPAIEAGRIYVHFGNYGTACLDTKTLEVVWQRRDLACSFSVGPGSSPILYKNLLILTMDGVDFQYVVALDKKTGKTVWKQDRSVTKANPALTPDGNERHKSFNTPVVVTVNGKPTLFSQAALAAYAYDPETGQELWHVRHNGYSNSSRPVVGEGLVYMNIGYDRSSLLAIRLEGKGNVTNTHVAWELSRAMPYKPSPILANGMLTMVNDNGIVTCLDAKSGKEVWQQRIGGNYSASPLYAEGRLYCFSQEGKITVLKAGSKFEVLAENTLPGGFMASPAVSGKALFLRSKTHLYRIEQ
jgi:outer membrane protein assembly factor BamB